MSRCFLSVEDRGTMLGCKVTKYCRTSGLCSNNDMQRLHRSKQYIRFSVFESIGDAPDCMLWITTGRAEIPMSVCFVEQVSRNVFSHLRFLRCKFNCGIERIGKADEFVEGICDPMST